ncbi:hypothetical protein B0H11DRAFT_2233430 [Mycena galericulata]|nr:hypothetical protein B0H11DRAFT_2233430 [Mycena galericulata]
MPRSRRDSWDSALVRSASPPPPYDGHAPPYEAPSNLGESPAPRSSSLRTSFLKVCNSAKVIFNQIFRRRRAYKPDTIEMKKLR